MSRWTQLSGATALACVFSASAGFADVTAQQVWGDWKSYLEGFGYTVSATETTDSDTLLVSEVTMAFSVPEADGTFEITMPDMAFQNLGDGTVSIDMPGTSTMVIEGEAEGEEFRVVMEMDLSNATTLVSGDTDDLTYQYDATSIAVAITEFTIVEEDAPDDIQMSMVMNNVSGSSSVKVGATRDMAQTMSVGSLTYDMQIADDGVNVALKGALSDVGFDGTASMPIEFDLEDPNALFTSGFSTGGTFTQGSSSVSMNVVENEQAFSLQSNAGVGELEMAIGEDGLRYLGGAKDLSISATGAELPFPISFAMEEIGYKFVMPLAASDQPQDFGLGLTFAGVAVPDVLWNIFDPSEVLPREPATVSFDLDGTAILTEDLTNPEIEDAEEFPGELLSLSLKDLVVEIAGAELTGLGNFTFDNSDLDSFDGMPRPLGSADFRLLGGNGLLDKVVQMGFVSAEQAMGARMMMGLFAVAGPAEDELRSTIEVNEEGHVLANGQRIK
ncbi:DUF2125 domain-containing protein [Cognatishimia maritima]|uniref:DUF2125 domain-containing protein n=1 Tax=Cognatishimia maritima TaxID=870908 RepID=A0A1M5T122_9RHOB|nr:DUF2125 domain-containing protein [Cognatishimia maritima]SHH44425.1 hypothetical protein SAMN04488044_2552 [Cognatishimia maritima]